MATKLTSEHERINYVLDHARAKMPTGMFKDQQALERAEELGLVERYYRGALSVLGLSYLRLTEAGRTALSNQGGSDRG